MCMPILRTIGWNFQIVLVTDKVNYRWALLQKKHKRKTTFVFLYEMIIVLQNYVIRRFYIFGISMFRDSTYQIPYKYRFTHSVLINNVKVFGKNSIVHSVFQRMDYFLGSTLLYRLLVIRLGVMIIGRPQTEQNFNVHSMHN